MKMTNVMQIDIEQSCFCCPTPTRLIVIEPDQNFPICWDCLLAITAVEFEHGKVVN